MEIMSLKSAVNPHQRFQPFYLSTSNARLLILPFTTEFDSETKEGPRTRVLQIKQGVKNGALMLNQKQYIKQ